MCSLTTSGLECHVRDNVLYDDAAVDVSLDFLVHPVLEEIHGWDGATTHAAPALALLPAAAASILARIEVCATQVRSSVVVGAVGLASAARFAIGEELAVSRGIFADPHSAEMLVVTLDVAAQFVVAVKALRLIIAELAEGCLAWWLLTDGAGDFGFVLYSTVCVLNSDKPRGGQIDLLS